MHLIVAAHRMLIQNSNKRFIWSRFLSTALKYCERDDVKKNFVSVFPEVVDTLTNSTLYLNSPTFINHYAEMLKYNVLKNKRFRPAIFLYTYSALEEQQNLTEKNLHLANILAWCIELFHSSALMNDDLMDGSELRGNEIAWNRKKSVGLSAINDAVLMFEGAFILLKKFFFNHKAYFELSDLLRNMNLITAVGQTLDRKYNINGRPAFELFSTENYKTTVRCKTCVPVVEGPVRAALILSNSSSRRIMKEITEIVEKLGEAVQFDNDILDVFDNGNIKSQIGTDIREGKCTWLATQVLEHGSRDLQKIFRDNYGRPGEEFERKVLEVYTTMDLYQKYTVYQDKTRKFISERTDTMSTPSLRRAVLNLVEDIFPRVGGFKSNVAM